MRAQQEGGESSCQNSSHKESFVQSADTYECGDWGGGGPKGEQPGARPAGAARCPPNGVMSQGILPISPARATYPSLWPRYQVYSRRPLGARFCQRSGLSVHDAVRFPSGAEDWVCRLCPHGPLWPSDETRPCTQEMNTHRTHTVCKLSARLLSMP